MTDRNASSLCVEPNGVIGILGGGQLGRMLAMAAGELGLKTHIYTPQSNSPAADVSHAVTIAEYDNREKLSAFGKNTDVVTFEFENVPAETVEILQSTGVGVAPGARALAAAQDRLVEKEFIRSIGASTAPFHAVDDLESLEAGLQAVGRPAILKTRRLGYDGKGQTVIKDDDTGDLTDTWEDAKQKAWDEIGARPSILEGFVDFDMEISILGARSRSGEVAMYDAPHNYHQGGILRRSTVPSLAPEKAIRAAREVTAAILSELDYVGGVGVEFFVLKDGNVLVNEFAPRVHNSGHWTSDACACSQFEQHIRAVAGWPLGNPARHCDAVMENLIGDDARRWRELAKEPQACVHLYGKNKIQPGRKMGHVTKLSRLSGD